MFILFSLHLVQRDGTKGYYVVPGATSHFGGHEDIYASHVPRALMETWAGLTENPADAGWNGYPYTW